MRFLSQDLLTAANGRCSSPPSYQVSSSYILQQRDGKRVSMDPQEFCTAVNRKSHWEATIYVMGEPFFQPHVHVPYF